MGRGNSPISYIQQILPDAAVTLKKIYWTERELLKEGKVAKFLDIEKPAVYVRSADIVDQIVV